MAILRNELQGLIRSHRALLDAVTTARKLFRGPPPHGMIALLYVGRAGRTVLASLLSQHPQIAWAGEPFDDGVRRRMPGFKPTRSWVRSVIEYNAFRRRSEYFGMETHQLQFGPERVPMQVRDYINMLEELGFTHFILLKRSNLLRIVILHMVVQKVRALHLNEAPTAPTQVRIDPAAPWGAWAGPLLGLIDTFQNFYADVADQLRGRRILELNYETDIQHDPKIAYEKVCGFLETDPVPATVRLARTNPFAIEQMVSNFDELREGLRGSGYEWMLHA